MTRITPLLSYYCYCAIVHANWAFYFLKLIFRPLIIQYAAFFSYPFLFHGESQKWWYWEYCFLLDLKYIYSYRLSMSIDLTWGGSLWAGTILAAICKLYHQWTCVELKYVCKIDDCAIRGSIFYMVLPPHHWLPSKWSYDLWAGIVHIFQERPGIKSPSLSLCKLEDWSALAVTWWKLEWSK